LAGRISDGVALRAALTLGADLAYMGTKFLATVESMAPDEHKRTVAASSLDDIVLTSAFTGLPTSMWVRRSKRPASTGVLCGAAGADVAG
jgi:nitronate monooxygenase